MTELTCTYCGSSLGSTESHSSGDEVHCEDCNATFDLRREDEIFDLVIYECPYCGYENKRDRGVEDEDNWPDGDPVVRCENDDRIGGDCGRKFDPTGANKNDVSDGSTLKMVPRVNN